MLVLWGIVWNVGARDGTMLVLRGWWYRLPREQASQVVETLLRVVLMLLKTSLAVVLMQSVEFVNNLFLA